MRSRGHIVEQTKANEWAVSDQNLTEPFTLPVEHTSCCCSREICSTQLRLVTECGRKFTSHLISSASSCVFRQRLFIHAGSICINPSASRACSNDLKLLKTHSLFRGFDSSVAPLMKIRSSWNLTLCRWLWCSRRFESTIILRNVENYTTSQRHIAEELKAGYLTL